MLLWFQIGKQHKINSKKGVVMYRYGMRIRGYGIGCQPMHDLYAYKDDITGNYWSILLYHKKLSDKEVRDYQLDYLGEETKYKYE